MDLDLYLEQLVAARPTGPGAPVNVVALSRVGSTNALARRIAAEYEREDLDVPALLLVAEEQTAGRGRQGRSWSSPRGKGVYLTLVRRLAPASALPTLPLLVGIAMSKTLDRYLPRPSRLKWPNDLRTSGRKIGGVLIEARLRPSGEGEAAPAGLGEAAAAAPADVMVTVLIGIGINHGHEAEDFPEGAPAATSLELEGVGEVPMATLTWELVGAVDGELARFGESAYAVAAYRERSEHAPGDRLRCRGAEGEVAGTFLGFDEGGRLRLEVDGEERRLAAGEVVEN